MGVTRPLRHPVELPFGEWGHVAVQIKSGSVGRLLGQAELHEVVMNRLVEVLEALSASRALSQAAPRAQLAGLASTTSRELRPIMERKE